jgi:hypothetical protein
MFVLAVASPMLAFSCVPEAMFVFSGPHAAFAFDMPMLPLLLLLRRRPRRRRLRRRRLPLFMFPPDILVFCIDMSLGEVVLEFVFCAEDTNRSAPTKASETTNTNKRVTKLLVLLLLTVVSPPAIRIAHVLDAGAV